LCDDRLRRIRQKLKLLRNACFKTRKHALRLEQFSRPATSRVGLKRESRLCFHCGRLGMLRLLSRLERLRHLLARGCLSVVIHAVGRPREISRLTAASERPLGSDFRQRVRMKLQWSSKPAPSAYDIEVVADSRRPICMVRPCVARQTSELTNV
jgi:hypothetical protein